MSVRKVNVSTIQIVGGLVAIAAGVADGLLKKNLHDGLLMLFIVAIFTLCFDIYYGSLGESRQVNDALRSYPVLKDYEYCIYEYPQLRDSFVRRSTAKLGSVLAGWMDEKIRAHQSDAQSNWAHGRMHFPQQEVEARTVQIQSSIDAGGFATQLEANTDFWAESAATYLADTRALAKQGKKITRVFILPSEESLKNHALIKQIRMDKDATISTLVAFSKRITDPEAVKDFGIWDEKLLCLVESTHHTGQVAGCTYSVADADLIKARRWRDTILRHAEPAERYLK
jgi:hypothetical protein